MSGYEKVDWSLNYRKNKRKYVIGKGQFGVLMYEPYKSEILPHWKYKNPEVAKKSAKKILEMFYDYLKKGDFPGADMAKKYLHMGNTRSLRYAKYPGGKKYVDGKERKPIIWASPEKYKVSRIFRKAWKEAADNLKYQKLKQKHKKS